MFDSIKNWNSFSALTILLLFFCFIFSLFLSTGALRVALTVMSIISILGFSVFVILYSRKEDKDGQER